MKWRKLTKDLGDVIQNVSINDKPINEISINDISVNNVPIKDIVDSIDKFPINDISIKDVDIDVEIPNVTEREGIKISWLKSNCQDKKLAAEMVFLQNHSPDDQIAFGIPIKWLVSSDPDQHKKAEQAYINHEDPNDNESIVEMEIMPQGDAKESKDLDGLESKGESDDIKADNANNNEGVIIENQILEDNNLDYATKLVDDEGLFKAYQKIVSQYAIDHNDSSLFVMLSSSKSTQDLEKEIISSKNSDLIKGALRIKLDNMDYTTRATFLSQYAISHQEISSKIFEALSNPEDLDFLAESISLIGNDELIESCFDFIG